MKTPFSSSGSSVDEVLLEVEDVPDEDVPDDEDEDVTEGVSTHAERIKESVSKRAKTDVSFFIYTSTMYVLICLRERGTISIIAEQNAYYNPYSKIYISIRKELVRLKGSPLLESGNLTQNFVLREVCVCAADEILQA